MEQLYDVVFFGLQPDKDPAEVAQAIAKAFSVPLDKAEALINRPSGTLIKKSVPANVAEQFQRRLVNAGVKANYKPSVNSANKLELVAVEEDAESFKCPACDKPVENDDSGERPLVCPHCHIVFAKFEQNRQRREEEKLIRERLERMKHLQGAEDERKRQQEEEEARKKQLEENIRQQLGLANKVVNSRTGLISSATLLLVLGVGLGVVVSKLFLSEPQKLPPSETPAGLAAAAGGLDLETLTQTANQIVAAQTATIGAAPAVEPSSSVASAVAEATAEATTAASGSGVSPPSGEASVAGTSTAESATPVISQAPAFDSEPDPEWDAYLLSQVNLSVAQDAFAKASRLALEIEDIRRRYQAQMDMVLGYQRRGQSNAADALLNTTLDNIATVPSLVRRVELATEIIAILVGADQPVLAARALVAAEPWLNAISSPGEQAQAWARMAWAQAWLGLTKDSDASIKRAVATLRDPMPELARVQAMSDLGEALLQRGARTDAESILAQARTLADGIEQPVARDEALAALARVWARNGNLARTVEVAQEFASSTERDQVLLDLLQQQALSGQSFGLTSVAEIITTPLDQARAYAMLGRTSADPSIGAAHFQHAESISGRLQDQALMQVRLLGEIARYRSRVSGQVDFARAEERVQQFAGDPQGEAGWEQLVANAARAGDLALAERYLGQITVPEVAARARSDLARVRQALAAMPGAN